MGSCPGPDGVGHERCGLDVEIPSENGQTGRFSWIYLLRRYSVKPMLFRSSHSHHQGVSMIEIVVSMAIVVVLLGTLIPALSSARKLSYREQCASNLTQLGAAWDVYLETNRDNFPLIVDQPSWRWGGVRHSRTNEDFVSLDYTRPISRTLAISGLSSSPTSLFSCPADRGIRNELTGEVANDQSIFRTYGTSYQANPMLFNAALAGADTEPRALNRSEIQTPPAAQVLLGDPTWYESYYETGRSADWHGEPGECNLLFLDGSVRFRTVKPRGNSSPVIIEPILRAQARVTGSPEPTTEDAAADTSD